MALLQVVTENRPTLLQTNKQTNKQTDKHTQHFDVNTKDVLHVFTLSIF